MADDVPPTSRRYALAQTVLLCGFAVAVIADPGPRLLPPGGALRTTGTVLCAAGVLLLLAAIGSLRRVVQIAPEPRADGELVMHGPYRWLRHPIYTAIMVIAIGFALRQPTPLVAIAATTVIVFLAYKARFEERLLLERYPGYAEYMRRTRGLFPWSRGSAPGSRS